MIAVNFVIPDVVSDQWFGVKTFLRKVWCCRDVSGFIFLPQCGVQTLLRNLRGIYRRRWTQLIQAKRPVFLEDYQHNGYYHFPAESQAKTVTERGIEWSHSIQKCSQNLAFAPIARKNYTGSCLLVLTNFFNCSHAQILVKMSSIARNFIWQIRKNPKLSYFWI